MKIKGISDLKGYFIKWRSDNGKMVDGSIKVTDMQLGAVTFSLKYGVITVSSAYGTYAETDSVFEGTVEEYQETCFNVLNKLRMRYGYRSIL